MKTTIVPIDFSDVNGQDFNHYFGETLAVWSFRDKKRLFLITGVEADSSGSTVINGQYLTKNMEFKYKALPWKDWNKSLSPVLSRAITFDFQEAAACFCPNRSKELKKGMKMPYSSIKYFGAIADKNKMTAQEITYAAFRDLYEPTNHPPTLADAFANGLGKRTGIACKKGFILSKDGLYYRRTHIGHYHGSGNGNVEVRADAKGFIPYLINVEQVPKARLGL